MHSILRYFLALWLMAFAAPMLAASTSRLVDNNRQWLSLSGDKLLEMAQRHNSKYASSDTAFVCYTILAERYQPTMKRGDKLQCVEALHQLWNIYFFQHSDYATGFDMLSKALGILEETGQQRIDIFIDMGAMYLTVAGSTNSQDMYKQAISYFSKAFAIAMKEPGKAAMENADISMINMLISAFGAQQIDTVDAEWQQYKAVRLKGEGQKEFRPQYASTLYDYYKALKSKDFAKAMQAIDRQISLSRHGDATRFLYMSLLNKKRVLRAQRRNDEAIEVMKQAERVATKLDMNDLLIGVYANLDTLYRETGHTALHELYRDRYYQLKDTLSNYQQLKWVGQMEAQSSINGISAQVHDLMAKSQHQTNVIQMLAVIAAIIVVFSVIMVLQNRRLKQSNLKLYAQIQATISAEERHQSVQQQLALSGRADTADAAAAPACAFEQSASPHRTSQMDSDNRRALASKIEQVMETSAEIYSPDFSIERLSALVGSKYRYVSQAINEQFDCNFNVYIGKYRIREACKRLSDVEHYGNLTFEAIANSVGYKSRSAFASAFKSVTGLTPSEYKNIAISQHKPRIYDQNS